METNKIIQRGLYNSNTQITFGFGNLCNTFRDFGLRDFLQTFQRILKDIIFGLNFNEIESDFARDLGFLMNFKEEFRRKYKKIFEVISYLFLSKKNRILCNIHAVTRYFFI